MTASARGLFRATGKKSRPVAVRVGDDLAGTFEAADFLERDKDDFYPTPPEPTRAFLAAELERLRDFVTIWEPAAGDGAMVREIEAMGIDAFASDLIDRGCGALIQSFYEFKQHSRPSRAAITNPPFQECNTGQWIRHALETLDLEYLALLLPLNWTGASTRGALWAKHTPARVYIMRWRIDWTGQGANPSINAWYVWDKAATGPTQLLMLDRKDARQGELSI